MASSTCSLTCHLPLSLTRSHDSDSRDASEHPSSSSFLAPLSPALATRQCLPAAPRRHPAGIQAPCGTTRTTIRTARSTVATPT